MSFRDASILGRSRALVVGAALAFVVSGGGDAAAKPDKPAATTAPHKDAPGRTVSDDVPQSRAGAQGTATSPSTSQGSGAATSGRETVQRESRIEFDERTVQGQTAAGAIYLFQRGESEFRSMVKLPESFRERTIHPILPPSTKR